MIAALAGPRVRWHPVTGAVAIATLGLVAAAARLAEAGAALPGGAGGLSAFLAFGAISGFAVSGST